ncbi:hypothetical protein [Microbacterium arborescens]|uniref:hypothetical protein n=1 Tax=Microbacterium arborescens TaxID=33883 RepID=UPI003C719A3B
MPTSITVPDEIADEVRRFAAFIAADRAAVELGPDPVSSSAGDDIADYPLWPDSDVIALANAGTTTASHYRTIMDAVLAQSMAANWVSLDDLASWTGLKRSALSTFRTHLYRYINTHLPEGTVAPFTGAWGTELRPARGREVFYRVSTQCADQWTRIRPSLKETS